MSYYKRSIMYNLRSFVSSLVTKYIEYLQDDETENKPSTDELEIIKKVFYSFDVWLYQQTKQL